MVSPVPLSPTEAIVRYLDASRYVTYSTYCLLIYDHLLTFADELNLVWQSRSLNLVKVLFIFNRYAVPVVLAVDVAALSGGLPSATLRRMCKGWTIFDVVIELASLSSTTCITAMRVRNLWADRQDVDRFLIIVWLLQFLASVGMVMNYVIKNAGSFSHEPNFNICFTTVHQAWWLWIPAMIFHAIVFIAMITKALSTPRSEHTPFLSVLLVDGFLYFFVVFSSLLFNLLSWAVAPAGLAQLPHYSAWAIATIAITRFLLDLQKRYYMELGPPEEDPIDEIGMTGTKWSEWGNPLPTTPVLNDPFYAYYVAPFPMSDARHRRPNQQAHLRDDFHNDDPPPDSV